MKPSDRSRILVDHERKLAFVVNLKVGFGSLNSLLKAGFDLDSKIKQERKLSKLSGLHEYKVYYFYRDPYARTISAYIWWMVMRRETFGKDGRVPNPVFNQVRNFCRPSIVEYFRRASMEEKYDPEAFRLWLKILPKIYMSDAHLIPQSHRLLLYGLPEKSVLLPTPLSNLADTLYQIYGFRPEPVNSTARFAKDPLYIDELYAVTNVLYAEDFEFFNIPRTPGRPEPAAD
jgi:hypothetical protein